MDGGHAFQVGSVTIRSGLLPPICTAAITPAGLTAVLVASTAITFCCPAGLRSAVMSAFCEVCQLLPDATWTPLT